MTDNYNWRKKDKCIYLFQKSDGFSAGSKYSSSVFPIRNSIETLSVKQRRLVEIKEDYER